MKKSETVMVRIYRTIHKPLRVFAFKRKESMASVASRAIQEYMELRKGRK